MLRAITRVRRRAGSASARPRFAIAALFALALVLATPARALAWVEAHVASDDIRVQIDRTGSARVEHSITLKISGGPLKSFDIHGVDGDALADPDGYIAPLRGPTGSALQEAVPIAIEMVPADRRNARDDGSPAPPTLRVRFDDEKGIKRGVYRLLFRYKTDLAGRGLIKIDGAMGTVTWTSPIWDDGFDSARTTFELASAPTPPSVDAQDRPANEDDSAPAPSMFLSNVRRSPERDEIELLRTYAPKGEPITWAIRVDARALRAAPPKVAPRPSLSLPSSALGFGAGEESRAVFFFAGGVGLFLLWSVLVALKAREVARHSRAVGAAPRPLIPAPIFVRSAGAGLALVSGVALELTMKSGTLGAALVALSAALAAHRTPIWTHASTLRGRGRWLPVAEREAFRPPPRPKGAYLDVSTRAGKALLFFFVAGLAAGVAALMRAYPYYAYLVALDVAPLLALFCTGRLAELPPDPASAPARVLGDIARRARRLMRPERGEEIRAVGRIHVPDNSPDADELRLGLVPKSALPGFLGIEVGVVYVPGAGGAIAMPEILLRVATGSECDAATTMIARHGRIMRGRKQEERVIAFTPRLPTAKMTASLAAALARAVMAKPALMGAKAGKGKDAKDKGAAASKAKHDGRRRRTPAPSPVVADARLDR